MGSLVLYKERLKITMKFWRN